jgi:S-adenosylmethionine:tRNA ribosyltransferase-isomerase
LLVVGATDLLDKQVKDLPDLLRPGDILVSNDTKVIPARLTGLRGEAKVEVTVLERVDMATWTAFARPAKKLKKGDLIRFAPDFQALVRVKGDMGQVTLDFQCDDAQIMLGLDRYGIMPLPPYIRGGKADSRDTQDYQTIFAREQGAVAAPTAGLHFTPELLTRLEQRHINRTTVTLHVGAGTFLPVTAEDTADHVMHREWGTLSQATVDAISHAKQAGGRLVAVGTTSARLLESAAADGTLRPFAGFTDIFITPGYKFKAVDVLMTNFHLPKSTLFMLVSAFAGPGRMKRAYAHATQRGYRFYSYGDACLLEQNHEP